MNKRHALMVKQLTATNFVGLVLALMATSGE